MPEKSPEPRISLITCTKNSARWLPGCLASIQSQAVQPFEHIIVDGGSTDGTLDIVSKFAPKARIIMQTGEGLYAALNQGLREASGDIVGFLHADDVFADERCLERITKAFRDNPELAFYCSRMKIYDEDLKQPFAVLGAPPHLPTLREELYSSNYFAHPTYYCSREIIATVGAYDEDYAIASDIDWLMRLERLSLPCHFDNKILIKFRSHNGISAKNYFLALREEFNIRKKQQGLSARLLFIYGWHFLRRCIRWLLERLGLAGVVSKVRQQLIRLVP